MKNITVLGVDPGIAHTSTAVIKAKTVGYSLITAKIIKTFARDETGKHLSIIRDEIKVKGHGDDAFFLTEQAIESVIALRKAKVANLQIKAVLEKAGVDFFVLTRPSEPPVTMQTQLHQIGHEAVESTFQ